VDSLYGMLYFMSKTPEDISLVKTYLKYGADPNYKNNSKVPLILQNK
jgi:hypothetical protein